MKADGTKQLAGDMTQKEKNRVGVKIHGVSFSRWRCWLHSEEGVAGRGLLPSQNVLRL